MVKRITVVNFIIIDSEDWVRGFTASNCYTISDSIVLVTVAQTVLAEHLAHSVAAEESMARGLGVPPSTESHHGGRDRRPGLILFPVRHC